MFLLIGVIIATIGILSVDGPNPLYGWIIAGYVLMFLGMLNGDDKL